jgi:hypothetical protein
VPARRGRFSDSPVERFMRPGPYQAPQLFVPIPQLQCDIHKPGHSKSRSAQRKGC